MKLPSLTSESMSRSQKPHKFFSVNAGIKASRIYPMLGCTCDCDDEGNCQRRCPGQPPQYVDRC